MAAYLKLVLSESDVNIIDNTSKVTAKLYYYGNGVSFNSNNPKGTITIDGEEFSFNHDFTTSTSSQWLATKSKTVTHNNDGSKTVSVSASFKTGVSLGTLKKSATLVLTTIPRASDLSLNKTTVPADGKTTVIATATKKVDSYTDVLTVSLGNYSQTIASGTAFTIPMDWMNAISGTSAVATVKVESFNEDVSIGTNTVDLEVTVPDTVVPTISNVSITEAVTAVKNAFGSRFVQNLSQLNVSIAASGAYGSTIKSYSTTLDGVNYIQQAFTSNVLNTAGTLNVVVTVTDSRGRTASKTTQIKVVEYAKPTITAMTYANGESSITVTIAGNVYPVEQQNSKTLKLLYKTTSDTSYTVKNVTVSDWSFNLDVVLSGDPSLTYELIAELTDKMNTNNPETFKVTTGVVVLSRHAGGDGITLFEEAKQEGFVVGGGKPAHFSGDVTFADTEKFVSSLGLDSSLTSMFSTDTITTGTVEVAGSAYKASLTVTGTKAGYYPIGIVGFCVNGTNQPRISFSDVYMSASAVGSVTITYSLSNWSQTYDYSGTIDFNVLWLKAN